MSEKKTADKITLAQKMRVMQKLFASGCRTEKDLQTLSMENVLQIEGITIQDMTVIMTIQKNVKAHTLFSYLGGGNGQDGE